MPLLHASQVKFWCLQTLHEVVRSRYASLPSEARLQLKQALLSGSTGGMNAPPAFLRNKVSLATCVLLSTSAASDESTHIGGDESSQHMHTHQLVR